MSLSPWFVRAAGQIFSKSYSIPTFVVLALCSFNASHAVAQDTAGLNCDAAYASPSSLWPPNHKFKNIEIKGIQGLGAQDSFSTTVGCIRQDEPLNDIGDGNTNIDGDGIGSVTARVMAERQGGGNGRVYHIGFTAESSNSGSCAGVVTVGVPSSKKKTAIDDGPLYGSNPESADCELTGIINTAPLAVDQSLLVESAQPLAIALTGSDPEDNELTFSILQSPLHGTLTGTAPDLIYLSEPGYSGSDQFTFIVSDGLLESTGVVVLDVTTPIAELIAVAQNVLLDEDTTLTLLLNATGGNGGELVYTVTSEPLNGVITGTAPNLLYTPLVNYSGSDSFVFQVADGDSVSESAVVSIDVSAVNDAPIVADINVTTDEDQSIEIILTGDDFDDDALIYSVTTQPSNGTLTGVGSTWTYQPDANYAGDDAFSYTVSDDEFTSNTATVSIAITNQNDAPVAVNSTVTIIEDTPNTFPLIGSDAEQSVLTFSVIDEPTNGTYELVDGEVSYTPAENFFGDDQLSFTVSDGELESNIATALLTIEPVNDAPDAGSDQLIDVIDQASIDVLLFGSDVDTTDLEFSIISQPASGMATLTGQTLTYTPAAEFSGSDSLVYSVSDGEFSDEATLSFDVLQNTAPTFLSTPNPTTVRGALYEYTAVGEDADDDALIYALVSGPDELSIDPQSGALMWIADTAGTFPVIISVADDRGGVTEQSFTLTVDNVAEPTTYQGRDFWLAQSWNVGGSAGYFRITISSIAGANGNIEIPLLGINEAFSVAANDRFTYDVSTDNSSVLLHAKGGEIKQNGIHITTDADVAVYALNQRQYSTDGFLVLPTESLGIEHVVVSLSNENSYPLSRPGAYFSVLATEDNTRVTLRANYDYYEYTGTFDDNFFLPYTPVEIILNRGESIASYLLGSHHRADPTGTRINSDKPVAVQGGHECAFLPYGRFQACDHLVEQTTPVTAWGIRYVSAPLATRNKGDLFRVYSAYDDTVIKINGALVANLEGADFYETVLEEPSVFESNKPILVAQFSTGTGYGGSTLGSKNADPFMMLVPASEQYLTSYVVSTPSDAIGYNFTNIIVPAQGISSVTHNGIELSADLFQQIGDSDFYFAQLPIEVGVHKFESSYGFGLSIYGFDIYESYGYVGGMSLGNASDAQRLVISLDESLSIDEEACVGVSVLDASDARLAAVQVKIDVTGQNEIEQYVFTNSAGTTQICYTSAGVGTDQVRVSSGSIAAESTLVWTSGAEANYPPYFTSVPPLRAFEWAAYEYAPAVSDGDGDSIVYQLLEGPADVVFDSATGRINWCHLLMVPIRL